MADEPNNSLLFVGYQSALSLGSKIQRGMRELPILGDDGKMKTLNILSLAAIIAGAIAGGGGTTSQAVATTAMAASETLALKYTREMEQEADQNGLHTLVRAGYDPNGLLTFLSRLSKISGSMPKIPTHLATHPDTENRIAFLQNILQIEPRPEVSLKPTADFKRIQMRAFVEEREPHVAVSHFESVINANPGCERIPRVGARAAEDGAIR